MAKNDVFVKQSTLTIPDILNGVACATGVLISSLALALPRLTVGPGTKAALVWEMAPFLLGLIFMMLLLPVLAIASTVRRGRGVPQIRDEGLFAKWGKRDSVNLVISFFVFFGACGVVSIFSSALGGHPLY